MQSCTVSEISLIYIRIPNIKTWLALEVGTRDYLDILYNLNLQNGMKCSDHRKAHEGMGHS